MPRVGRNSCLEEKRFTDYLVKYSTCNVQDLGSIPGLERSSGEGNGYPLQYSGLENSMGSSSWGRKELDTTKQVSPT